MNIPALIHDVKARIPEKGACYTISKVISEVINDSKIVFVVGTLENEQARKLRERAGLSSWLNATINIDDIINNDGYTIGVGIGVDKNNVMNFHAVLYLLKTNMIIDATIEDFSRPKYGLDFKPFYGKVKTYRRLYVDFKLFDMEDIYLKTFDPLIKREPDRINKIIADLKRKYN